MKIAVVGSGYVGLVTGTCLAETGNYVTCIDIDVNKIEKLNAGVITIYEPGLEVIFKRNLKQERLFFTSNLAEGIKGAKIIFLALPTPPGENGSADLQYILKVSEEIGKLVEEYIIIVNKSTVPVGTTEKVRKVVEKNTKTDFDVVSNPEFLREGVAVDDFMKPDRIVIGSSSDKAKKIMESIYLPLVRQGNPIIIMDEKSAELTKYAANSFLATKISFMNEIANICDLLGANIDNVRKGIGTDDRIGKRFLFAGIGYGGSCFPKDVLALHKSSDEVKYDFKILNSVMEVNALQKTKLIKKAKLYFNGNLSGKVFGVWGLAFKPYTDDIREAPAIENIKKLLSEGASIQAFDPEAMENVERELGSTIKLCDNQYQALENADALFIFTEWPVFRTPDFEKMISLLKRKVIFDGRNLYEIDELNKLGFTYFNIGRNNNAPR
jgi:UDPglucose 6-dehydrogenase